MILIFDTNVLISAFLTSGPSRDVFEYAARKHQLITSSYILGELKEKWLGKLGFSLADYRQVEKVILSSVVVKEERMGHISDFSDKDDLPILDLCVTVKADFLLTRDKKILELGAVKYTRVIHPRDFWEIEKRTGGSGEFTG